MAGLVGLGLAACGDKVTVAPPVTPTPGVTSVSVAPQNITIAINQQVQYAASVIADAGVATTVTWSSGNSAIATVDAAGMVKGISAGTTTIVATSTADVGKKGIASVTVSATPPDIISFTISPTTATLAPGNFVQISPAFVMSPGAAAPTPTYSTSNAAVATVDASGKVVAVAAGTAIITATAVSGTSTLTATLGVTVRALIPATISISSVTTGILTLPVVLTNVNGQIEFNLNFDPGEQTIDSIAVFIGAKVAAKQTYVTNPAAGIITLSVNTANFVKDPILGTATVDYLNGNSTISAAIYPRNVATATATQTTPVVLNNLDGWAADITKPSVSANSAGGITFWGGPTAPASAILYPVIYTPSRSISTVTWTIGAAGGGACSTVTQTALPFTTTFGATGTTACGYENTTVIRDNILVTAALDNSNNTYPLVNLVTPLIPNTIVLGATPDSLRLDYVAPTVSIPSIVRSAPAVTGWVNASFNFINFASTDAGVGLRATRDRAVTYSAPNCGGSTDVVMPTGTGTDIPECATNAIGGTPAVTNGTGPYFVVGTESDRLGNVGTSNETDTFGVDKTAPTIRWGIVSLAPVLADAVAEDTIFATAKPTTEEWRAEFIDLGLAPSGFIAGAQSHSLSTASHILPTGSCSIGTGSVGATFVTAPGCGMVAAVLGSLRADGWLAGQSVVVPQPEGYYGYSTKITDEAGNASSTLFRKALVNTESPMLSVIGMGLNPLTNASMLFQAAFADSAEVAGYALGMEYPAFLALTGNAETDSITYPINNVGVLFNDAITSPYSGTVTPGTGTPYVRHAEAVTATAFPGSNVDAAPANVLPTTVSALVWNFGGIEGAGTPAPSGTNVLAIPSFLVEVGVNFVDWNTANPTQEVTNFRVIPDATTANEFGSTVPLRAQLTSASNNPNPAFARVDFYRYDTTELVWKYLGSSTSSVYSDQGTYRSYVFSLADGSFVNDRNGNAQGAVATGDIIAAVGVTAAGDGIVAGVVLP